MAQLGQAKLITKEDGNGDDVGRWREVQAPDYFVALKNGERYLVEVKNWRLKISRRL